MEPVLDEALLDELAYRLANGAAACTEHPREMNLPERLALIDAPINDRFA
jgi:hypothetical protein